MPTIAIEAMRGAPSSWKVAYRIDTPAPTRASRLHVSVRDNALDLDMRKAKGTAFLSRVKKSQQLNLKGVHVRDAQSVQYSKPIVFCQHCPDRPRAVAGTRDACGLKRKGERLFHISYLQMHRFIIIIGSF
jgi:hypothetical protein